MQVIRRTFAEARTLSMFGKNLPRAQPTWRAVEDDFILGARAHNLFGFASRTADGRWSTFDENSQPLGIFDELAAAQASLWQSHQLMHANICEKISFTPAGAGNARARTSEARGPLVIASRTVTPGAGGRREQRPSTPRECCSERDPTGNRPLGICAPA